MLSTLVVRRQQEILVFDTGQQLKNVGKNNELASDESDARTEPDANLENDKYRRLV